MRRSFARQRLHGLLMSQAFGALGAIVACVADLIVAGNLVGVDALAGIAATVPVLTGAQFVARLVYCGAGYLFAKCQGEMDPTRARRTVGLAIEAAVVIGVLTYVLSFFGRDLYFDMMGLSGGVREQAGLYWRWIFVYYALFPLTMTMWRLVYADGEAVTTAIADTLSPPLTVILSIVFTKMTGTAAGAALGILIGMSATDLVMTLHVLRKSNAVVPVWNVSWRGLKELVSYSLTDSCSKLCQCGLLAVVSKLVVAFASAAYLPVVSMVSLVLLFRDVLDRIGDAYMPVAEMYLGEGNLSCMRRLTRHSLSVSLVCGLVLAVVTNVLSSSIVAFYGIPRGEVFDHCVLALRISAMALPLSSVMSFVCSHYLVLGYVRLSVVGTVLGEFLLTAGSAAGFCLAYGLGSLWYGFPVGCLMTQFTMVSYLRIRRRRWSLLLVPPDRDATLNLTFVPDASRIVRIRDVSERFLRLHRVGSETVTRIMLLVEEYAMSVADNNGVRSARVAVEVSFLVGTASVRVVLRDTGRICDVTDGDASVTSLRQFVISGLMRSYENRRYINTIGCNRAAFVFDNSISESSQRKKV